MRIAIGFALPFIAALLVPLSAWPQDIQTFHFTVDKTMQGKTIFDHAGDCTENNLCKKVVDSAFASIGISSTGFTQGIANINKIKKASQGPEDDTFNFQFPNGYQYCRAGFDMISLTPTGGERSAFFDTTGGPNGIEVVTWVPRSNFGDHTWVEVNFTVLGVRDSAVAARRDDGTCTTKYLRFQCRGRPACDGSHIDDPDKRHVAVRPIVPPPIVAEPAGAAYAQTPIRPSRPFQPGIGPFTFRSQLSTVNAALPHPFPNLEWTDLPVAGEYKTSEVRYIFLSSSDFDGFPYAGEFASCPTPQALFFFDQQGLFRMTIRAQNCPDATGAIRKIAAGKNAGLVTTSYGGNFSDKSDGVTFAGLYGNDWGSLEWAVSTAVKYQGQDW